MWVTLKMETISLYEQERLDNIRSNRVRLQELGLERRPDPVARRRPSAKRQKVEPVQGGRRSSRQLALAASGAEAPSYLDPEVRVWRARPGPKGDNEHSANPDPEAADADVEAAAAAVAQRAVPAPSDESCRTCNVDADAIVAAHLGKLMEGPPTKASVTYI